MDGTIRTYVQVHNSTFDPFAPFPLPILQLFNSSMSFRSTLIIHPKDRRRSLGMILLRPLVIIALILPTQRLTAVPTPFMFFHPRLRRLRLHVQLVCSVHHAIFRLTSLVTRLGVLFPCFGSGGFGGKTLGGDEGAAGCGSCYYWTRKWKKEAVESCWCPWEKGEARHCLCLLS